MSLLMPPIHSDTLLPGVSLPVTQHLCLLLCQLSEIQCLTAAALGCLLAVPLWLTPPHLSAQQDASACQAALSLAARVWRACYTTTAPSNCSEREAAADRKSPDWKSACSTEARAAGAKEEASWAAECSRNFFPCSADAFSERCRPPWHVSPPPLLALGAGSASCMRSCIAIAGSMPSMSASRCCLHICRRLWPSALKLQAQVTGAESCL